MKPVLSIIVVSFNTSKLTLETLESVQSDVSTSEVLNKRVEVIVIDNNSSDTSVDDLHAFAKTAEIPITVICNKKNVGYSTANNQGIAVSSASYLLLLNSDTIVQKGALEQLLTAFEKDEELGIVAATLLNSDGSLQPQGGHEPTLLHLTNHFFFFDDIPLLGKMLPSTQHTGLRTEQRVEASNTLHYQDWVGGTALSFRRKMIDEIGLLDEAIFMYGEDIEFCMRAKKHHWKVAIHQGAKVIHLQSQSSDSQTAILGELRGYHFIWAKHKPLWQLPFAKLIMEIGCLARAILYGTVVSNRKKAATYLKAIHMLISL